MSYILDALQKSEQARRRRKSRVLLEGPPEGPAASSKPSRSYGRWPYLIAIILLMGAGVFAYRLNPRQAPGPSSRPPGSASEELASRLATGASAPAASAERTGGLRHQNPADAKPQASGPTAEGEMGRGEPGPGDPDVQQSAPAVSPPTVAQSHEAQEPTERSPAPDAVTDRSEAAPVAGTQPRGAARNKIARDKMPYEDQEVMQGPETGHSRTAQTPAPPGPSAVSGGAAPAAGKAVASKAPHDPASADAKKGIRTANLHDTAKKTPAGFDQPARKAAGSGIISDIEPLAELDASSGKPASVLKWHQLGPQIRDSLPNMSFSMLIYSKQADQRWININGSKRREGEEISSGLKLEEITRDGAIFSFRGHRFFKSVVGD